jgi:hypothetical protein
LCKHKVTQGKRIRESRDFARDARTVSTLTSAIARVRVRFELRVSIHRDRGGGWPLRFESLLEEEARGHQLAKHLVGLDRGRLAVGGWQLAVGGRRFDGCYLRAI